jgi:hypothetical protein
MIVGFTTDVEGDYEHWRRVCSSSAVIEVRPDGSLALRDGTVFVFGGDAFDRGVGDVRVGTELVALKKAYPERVVLLMGNRDINKMRFTSELSLDVPPSEAFGAWWDPSAPTLAQYYEKNPGMPDTVTNRLQWALKHTLGR